jgi:predicted RNA binding protein YcfA (HicA-like mRNA interferase family)
LPARKVLKILYVLGFKVVRKRGSHVVLKHPDGRITVVLVHAKENIGPGLLLKIIKDAKLTREEFLKFLEKSVITPTPLADEVEKNATEKTRINNILSFHF